MVLDLSPAGRVHRTTYGHSFFDAIKLMPPSTKVNLDPNFLDNSYEIAYNQAAAAVQYLGSRWTLCRVNDYGFVRYLPLTPVGFTVGNEPDLYVPDGHKNASDWDSEISPRHGL